MMRPRIISSIALLSLIIFPLVLFSQNVNAAVTNSTLFHATFDAISTSVNISVGNNCALSGFSSCRSTEAVHVHRGVAASGWAYNSSSTQYLEANDVDSANATWIDKCMDLSAYDEAYVDFWYNKTSTNAAGEQQFIFVNKSGVGFVGIWQSGTGASAWIQISLNISSSISAETCVRYMPGAASAAGEQLRIDDFKIINTTYTADDTTLPRWTDARDNSTVTSFGGRAYRNEPVNISAIWSDNDLSGAWLATNETGAYRNYSGNYSVGMSGASATANFSWRNISGPPRPIGWIIYANDTANNTNSTNSPGVWQGNFTMWGWSNITWNSPASGSSYTIGSTVKLFVLVNDTNTSERIANYPVNFSWENSSTSTFLGTNYTNASGVAFWDWNTAGLYSGRYYPKGNITQNSTLFYNASGVYQANTTVTLYTVYNQSSSISLSMNSNSPRKYTSLKTTTQSFELTSSSPASMGATRFASQFLSSTQDVARILSQLRYAINDFTANDVISRLISIPRLISQQIDVSQIVSRFAILPRMISQQIDVSQITARIVQFSKSLSETFSINQVVSRFVIISKYSVNSFTTSTSNVIGRVYVRLVTTTASVTDVVQRILLNNRIVTNILSVNDALQRVFLSVRSGIQSLAVNSAVGRFITTIKYTSQSFTTNTIVSRFTIIPRTVADSFSVSSITSRFVIIPREISQSISVNNVVTRLASLSRSLNQTFNLNNIAARIAAFPRSITAQIAVSDSIQRVLASVRSSVQSFSVNQVVGRMMLAIRSSVNGFTANFAASRFAILPKVVSQQVNVNQIVSRFVILPRYLSDSFSLSAVAEKTSNFFRIGISSLSTSTSISIKSMFTRVTSLLVTIENIGTRIAGKLNDVVASVYFNVNQIVSRFATIPRAISQTFNLNQITTRIIIFSKSLSQTLNLNSTLTGVASFVRTTLNGFTANSVVSKFVIIPKAVVNSLNLQTITSKFSILPKVVSQQINVNQVVSRFVILPRTFSNSVGLQTITSRFATIPRAISQTFNLNQIAARIAAFPRSITAQINVSDVVQRMLVSVRSGIQSLSVNDVVSRMMLTVRSSVNGFTINAVVTRFVIIPRTVTDSLSVSSIANRLALMSRTATASLTFTAFSTVTGKLYQSAVSTFFSVTDAIQRSIIANRVASGMLNINEGIQRAVLTIRSIVNGFTINAVASRFATIPRLVSQQMNVNQIVSKIIIIPRTVNQAFNLNLITAKLSSFSRSITAQFTATDTVQRVLASVRSSVQSFSVNQVVSRTMLALKSINQSLTANDVISRFVSIPRLVSQQMNVNQIVGKIITIPRSIGQAVGFTVATAKTAVFTRFVSLYSTVNENVFSFSLKLYQRTASTALAITDVIQKTALATRNVIGMFSLDIMNRNISALSRTFSQTISLSGIPSKFSVFSRAVTDSFSTNSVATRFLIFTRFTGQAFSISQITTKMVLASRSITEGISTTTVSSRLLLLTRSFTQAFSITEYSTRIVPFQLYERIVSLTIGINNAIQRTAKITRSVIEGFNFTAISTRAANFFRTITSYFSISFGINIPCPPLCIPQPVTPASAPSGGGGGGMSAIVKPPTVAVEFVKWSILEEVIPGQATVQDILVKNKGDETIKGLKIEVEGISKEWIFVTPETIDLGPGEVKSFTISIAVPEDAESGDYRVIVTLKNSGVDDKTFFILRIRSYVRTDTPIVTRVIDLDYSKNRTEVDLTVRNTYKNISLVQVLEDVPKDLAKTSDEIEFITSPTEILRKDPLIQWDLLNMLAGESRTVSYAVKNILEEYSAYIYFPVREMNVITGKIPAGFKLVDFDIPPLFAGRSEVVTFTIKNADNATHSLQFYIELPKGWKADPEEIVANISANEVRKFRVSIVVPEGAVKGSYVIQTVFFWDENSFIREIQVTVAKPISMLLVLIIIIGVGTIVYIIVYRTKRRREIRPAIERIRRIAYEVGER